MDNKRTVKAIKAYWNLKRLLCQQPLLNGVLNQYGIFLSTLCWQFKRRRAFLMIIIAMN